MIGGLCHQGLLVEAEKLLREMEGKGCSPNGCTYNIIIRGLLNNNKTLWALEVIQEMVKWGFSADASTVKLIVGLLSKDEVDLNAIKLRELLYRKMPAPMDSTFELMALLWMMPAV